MAEAGGDRPLKLVTDANVWIDLDNGGLVALTFALPYQFASPDAVVAELGTELAGRLVDQGLQVVPRERGIGEEWLAFRLRYRRPSDEDIYALLLALERRWDLLTGDKDLRRAAMAAGLEVHGVLWVLDGLVSEGLLAASAAAEALRQIVAQGAWLPTDECDRRRSDWGRS